MDSKDRPIKKAFLVGVSDYGDSDRDLLFAKRDVEVLSEILRNKGFTCEEWIDKPLPGLLNDGVLKRFYEEAKNAQDTILFYFSGHGSDVAGEQILRGRGVKSASLSKGMITDNLLVLSNVLDELSKSAAQKIVIVDACRVPESDDGLAGALHKNRVSALQQLTNCAVIYASADGRESFGTPQNDISRFTLSLTQELTQYGRGVLATVEATMERLAKFPDAKSQTPWVYSSLRDKALDGFRIEEETLDGRFVKHLGSSGEATVWAVLAGSNALAQWQGGKFINRVRLPESFESMRTYQPHPNGNRHAFVKGSSSSVHEALVGPAASSWSNTLAFSTKLSGTGLHRVFGAWWSPTGEHLVAFGSPRNGKVGVALWKVQPVGFSAIKLQGMPLDLECNSAQWVSDTVLLVAGSRGISGTSCVFLLAQFDGKWEAKLLWKSSVSLRITAMSIAEDKNTVYLGADDGSVAIGIVSESNQPKFISREHPVSGMKTLALLPWTGDSRLPDFMETGVCSLARDDDSGIVGLTYFDGTVAFLDPALRSYVKTFSLREGARRARIVSLSKGAFLCQDGSTGRIFRIVRT